MIKFTFYYGLQIDVKNDKTEKMNIYGLSQMDPKLITLKLRQDLEDLARIINKNENFVLK